MPTNADLSRIFEPGASQWSDYHKRKKYGVEPHDILWHDSRFILLVARTKSESNDDDYSLSQDSLKNFQVMVKERAAARPDIDFKKPYVVIADRIADNYVYVNSRTLKEVEELVHRIPPYPGKYGKGPFWWISAQFEVVMNGPSASREIPSSILP